MSKRELEILDLISSGYTNKQIAEMLNIATYTVASHLFNIALKISDFMPDAENTRVRLARWYFENYLKGGNNEK